MKAALSPYLARGVAIVTFFVTIPAGVAHAQAPAKSASTEPTPLDLTACINMAMTRQPALDAARASLMAAQDGKKALDDIVLGRLLSPDLSIRREQACLGVSIAVAALQQVESETRYAVQRNFYSVQYAREQEALVRKVVERIDGARAKAIKLRDIGDPSIKVTQIDVDLLTLNVELIKTKQTEASMGVLRATAALREAIGLAPDFPLVVAAAPMPAPVKDLNKDDLVAKALANRAEMSQAAGAQQVTELEISAQNRLLFKPKAPTFAAGSDVHAKQVPQGVSNGEYRPGAIGLEMPTLMVGSRKDRVQRASDYNDRAVAVVAKTENLIALEVEAYYLKWLEASHKIDSLAKAPAMAANIYDKVSSRFNEGNASAKEYLETGNLEDQVRSQYNEALYQQMLALTALERATAGGYRIEQK